MMNHSKQDIAQKDTDYGTPARKSDVWVDLTIDG